MNLDMPELLNKISMEHQSSTTYSLQFLSFIEKWMYTEDREDKEIETDPQFKISHALHDTEGFIPCSTGVNAS